MIFGCGRPLYEQSNFTSVLAFRSIRLTEGKLFLNCNGTGSTRNECLEQNQIEKLPSTLIVYVLFIFLITSGRFDNAVHCKNPFFTVFLKGGVVTSITVSRIFSLKK